MSDEKNQNEEGAKQTPGDHWGSLVDDIGATPADDASTHPSETVGTDESESSAGDSGAGADSGFVNQLFGLRESEGESAVDAGEAGEEAVSEDRETPDEVAVKTNEKVHKAPFGAGLIEDIGLDAISESTANAADDTTVESPASEVVQADQIAEFSPPPTPRRPKLRSAPKSKGRLGWSSLADELGIDTEELAAAEELIESAASAEDEGEDVPTTGADAVVEVEASIDEAVEVTGFVEEVVDVLEDGTSDDGASDGDTPETSDERESTPFGTGILAPDELEAAEAALSSAAPDHRDEDKSSQNTAAQLPTGDARPSRRHKPKSAFGDGLGLDLGPDPHAKSEAEEELPEEAQPEKVPRFEKRQSEDRGGKSSRSREVVSRADSLSDELDGSADFDDDEFGGDDE